MIPILLSAAWAALPSLSEPLRTGNSAPQDAAVVIGLEDYAFLPDIPYARADAQVFADWLVYTRGVPADRVRLLTAGSVEDMRAAVAEARELAGPDGFVWVYYAGHGAASTVDRRLMLLGDDAKATASSFLARGVAAEELGEIASAGGRAFLVVDACQSGTGPDGASLIPGTRVAIPVEELSVPRGLAVWTSTSPGQLANPYPQARHGAFTYFVVGALRGWADGELDGDPDGAVTLEEASAYVERTLRTVQVDQRPSLRGVSDPSRVVALRARYLEQGPDASRLGRINPDPPVDPVTRDAPVAPDRVPRFEAPLSHVAGSTWADANGAPLSWGEVKGLAAESPEGRVAARRLRWGWTAPVAVSLVALPAFVAGNEFAKSGKRTREDFLEGSPWQSSSGLGAYAGGLTLMLGAVGAEAGVIAWRVVRRPQLRTEVVGTAEMGMR